MSLWEALFHQRPFAGDSFRELADAVQRGTLVEPPRSSKVPRWIVLVLKRGLATSPEQRYADMHCLLGELKRGRSRRRTHLAMVTVAALTVGAVGATWGIQSVERCSGSDKHLQGVWDTDRRTSAEHAILGTNLTFAGPAWELVKSSMDAYAKAWIDMHRETCLATTVRGEQSSLVMDLRMACLHRAKVQFDAAATVFVTADDATVRNASQVVAQLPDLDRCADVTALHDKPGLPSGEHQKEIQEAEALLAQHSAEQAAGHYEVAETRLNAAVAALAGVEHDPLLMRIDRARASINADLGRYEDARAALQAAFERAAQSGDIEVLQDVATNMVFVVGVELGDVNAGRGYIELARGLARNDDYPAKLRAEIVAALLLTVSGEVARAEAEFRRLLEQAERHPEASEETILELRANLANALVAAGKYEEAEEQTRIVVSWRERVLGKDHPRTADTLHTLANTLPPQGKYEEAESVERDVLARYLAGLGPDHPDVARTRSSLAAVLLAQGEFAEAESLARVALADNERIHGKEHPRVASAATNVATALAQSGKSAEAEPLFRRSVEILKAALGEDHPHVAQAQTNLGTALSDLGRYEDAVQLFEAAVATRERVLGPEHPKALLSRAQLATTFHEMGRHAAAEAEHRRVLEIQRRVLGPEHPDVADTLENIGLCVRNQGRPAEAAQLHRQSLALNEKHFGPNHPYTARSRGNLASDLLDLGRTKEALKQLQLAVAVLDEGADVDPHTREWLESLLQKARRAQRRRG